ncbi:Actin- protein 10 [Bachmanniomyces sp. S44760]|nr:Actin- protein 10 [Bachmanniomyces sp. S44760]
MAAEVGHYERRTPSAPRPGISQIQLSNHPSPHTPLRNFSSNFSSPSASYIKEEDPLIFEFGTRCFRAGFAGESSPRCTLGFGPDRSRRNGDYREWLPDYENRTKKRSTAQDWGQDVELWKMDLRGSDLGLIEDRVERTVREAFKKYLLLDSKSRKVILVVPSILPHPLLSTILRTIFENCQNPTVTLFSAPISCTVAAGLRSGLIVDIGWQSTSITGVYEYREVYQCETTRGMKLVTLETARILQQSRKASANKNDGSIQASSHDEVVDFDFALAEDITKRMVWCRSHAKNSDMSSTSERLEHQLAKMNTEDEANEKVLEDSKVSVPLYRSNKARSSIPSLILSHPIESVLIPKCNSLHKFDDDDQPLQLLTYKTLLSLPPDVRGVCMSRIIFTGGGSNIPGLKSRIVDEVSALFQERGWDPVEGKAADKRRHKGQPVINIRNVDQNPSPASVETQVPDPIENKIQHDRAKVLKPTVSGVFRGVETLGAWAGASLIASMRIKGVVEIERDTFLQYGFAAATSDANVGNVMLPRQSYGLGITRGRTGDSGLGERA